MTILRVCKIVTAGRWSGGMASHAGRRRMSALKIATNSWSDEEGDSDGDGHHEEETIEPHAMPQPSVSSPTPYDIGPLSNLVNRSALLQFQNQDFQYRVLRRGSGTKENSGESE